MARGSSQASSAATTAGNLSNSLEGQASALYGGLAPELEAEAANPSGYAPADLAAMNTAAEQSAGGSEAATVGQGALHNARTRNAGGANEAIAAGVRNAGENLSKRALGVQTENADLKQRQRQEGLSGLEGLYGEQTNAGIGASGQIANDVNANTNAQQASWDWAKYLLDPALGAAGESKYT